MFEVKATYQGIKPNGQAGKCSALYLIDAVNFGDAETKAFEHTEADNISDVKVSTAKKSVISEVIPNEVNGPGDFFKATLKYQDLDSTKVVSINVLTLAKDIKDAFKVFCDFSNQYVCDIEIVKVEKSPISEILEYEEEIECDANAES